MKADKRFKMTFFLLFPHLLISCFPMSSANEADAKVMLEIRAWHISYCFGLNTSFGILVLSISYSFFFYECLVGDKRSLFTSNYVHSDPPPYCPELLPFSQAQLASLMALSTQGGDVPLRIFAEHQVCLRWSIVF